MNTVTDAAGTVTRTDVEDVEDEVNIVRGLD